jgi:hypothetical protein
MRPVVYVVLDSIEEMQVQAIFTTRLGAERFVADHEFGKFFDIVEYALRD